MIRRIFYTILWIVGITMMVVSLGFSSREQHSVVCNNVAIDISDSSSNRFVSSDDISAWVKKKHPEIYGSLLDSINIRGIEEELEKLEAVETAVVYKALNSTDSIDGGTLIIKINQRTPVFRVFSRKWDYYVDRHGEIIMWTPKYTSRVILVIGEVERDFARKSILPMVRYMVDDPFWKAQIDHLFVSLDGELKLIPRVGDHEIIFGKPDNYEIKLRNLKKLYTDGLRNGGWTRYKTINLKYKNQIVCTKNKSD
jgi:cell division protein FtsQ